VIFNQVVEYFKYVSIFGNPRVEYDLDWREVIQDIEGLSKSGVFDLEKRQCTLNSALHIEILTSQVGLLDHL